MVDLPCDATTMATVPADDSFYESQIEFPNDCDWIKVKLEGGRAYAVSYRTSVESEPAYAEVIARAPDGRELASVPTSYPGERHLRGLDFYAATSGTYFVQFKGDLATTYAIAVGRDCQGFGKPAGCGLGAPGSVHKGKLQNLDDYDTFKVQLQAGTTYTFDLASRKKEPGRLAVRGKHRFNASSIDDAPPPEGFKSARRVVVTAPYTGSYSLQVSPVYAFDAPAAYRVTYAVTPGARR